MPFLWVLFDQVCSGRGQLFAPPCAVRLCSDGRSVELLCGIQTVDRQARQSCQLHATQTDSEKQASRLAAAERCRVPALDTATERPFVLTLKTLNNTVAATKGCSAKSLGANFKKKKDHLFAEGNELFI